MELPTWLRVGRRETPSAHVVLVATSRPVLVDAAFGSVPAVERTLAWLAAQGLAPADLTALALTHFHSDHVGGAAAFQHHGVPVLGHRIEAGLLAAGHPDAVDHALLGHDVPPFTIDRPLDDGDVIDAGEVRLEVVHVPSQTPGHVAYWEPREGVLLTGDLLQADDVAWVRFAPPWDEDALGQAVAAVERLAALDPLVVVPGHGPVLRGREIPAAVARTLDRYAAWAGDPRGAAARHAAPRIVVTALTTEPQDEAALVRRSWAAPIAAALGEAPEDWIAATTARLEDRGVLRRDGDGRLHAALPHEPPGPVWRPEA